MKARYGANLKKIVKGMLNDEKDAGYNLLSLL